MRPPLRLFLQCTDPTICPCCSSILWTREAIIDHWERGHFDTENLPRVERNDPASLYAKMDNKVRP